MSIENLEQDQTRQIMQILWAGRMINPEMSVEVREKDVQALDDCMNYLKQEGTIGVTKNQHGNMVIALVDKDGNSIRPIENNEEDFDRAALAQQVARAKEAMPGVAERVRNSASVGDFSASEIMELVDMALVLAKA